MTRRVPVTVYLEPEMLQKLVVISDKLYSKRKGRFGVSSVAAEIIETYLPDYIRKAMKDED